MRTEMKNMKATKPQIYAFILSRIMQELKLHDAAQISSPAAVSFAISLNSDFYEIFSAYLTG